MKVLILAENTHMGGINRYCIDLVQGLNEMGVSVSLMAITRRSDDREPWLLNQGQQSGIVVRQLVMHYFLDFSAIFRLRRILKHARFDIVHSQGYRSNIIGRLATRGLKRSIPSITTLHGIITQTDDSRRMRFYLKLDLMTRSWSHHFIAVDQGSKNHYVKLGICHENISVIHNGVSLPNIDRVFVNNNHKIIVGYVGRLSKEKGIDYLINVIKNVLSLSSQVEFLIIGDGPEKYLLDPLKEAPIENHVTCVGQVSDIAPYYRQMDLILVPSRSEGLPFVVLEAMSYGIPVIATHVGGLPEIIVSGENSILVSPDRTVEEITQTVLVLAKDHNQRTALGISARRTIDERFSQRIMCQKTLEMYRHILRRSSEVDSRDQG